MKQQLGSDFLVNNLVSDIPVNLMKSIKKEALDKYLPNDRRPIKAWGLAMASLRCLKRDLVKNKNKQAAALNKQHLEHTTITPLFSTLPSSNSHQNFGSSSTLGDHTHGIENVLHGISINNNNNRFSSELTENLTISSYALANKITKPLATKRRVSNRN